MLLLDAATCLCVLITSYYCNLPPPADIALLPRFAATTPHFYSCSFFYLRLLLVAVRCPCLVSAYYLLLLLLAAAACCCLLPPLAASRCQHNFLLVTVTYG